LAFLVHADDLRVDLGVPSGARDPLRSRLDPVSETGRQILSAAAVLGRSFDAETVRANSGRAEDETVAALEELSRRGLVRERNLDYDFCHEKLRGLVYAETSLARRAAEQARSVFANTEAMAHLRAALALGHPDPGLLHSEVGELQTLQGDYAGALASFEIAAASAGPEPLGHLEQRLGQVHHRRGEWVLAQAHLQAALDATPDADSAARARILADLSLATHSAGEPLRVADLARETLELAEMAGDLPALAQAHNLLGLLASASGNGREALLQLRASLALAEQVDDPGAQVAALNNLALTYRDSGEREMAIALTRRALDRCTVLGDRHREAALHNNLADLLHASSAPDEAMQHLKRAVALFAEVGAAQGPQPEIWKLVRW